MLCRGVVLIAVVSMAAADTLATFKILDKITGQCGKYPYKDMLSCFKFQAAKFADRAARLESLPIADGVTLVRRSGAERAFPSSLSEGDFNSLTSDQVDKYLQDATSKLMQSHRVIIAPQTFGEDVGRSLNQARGKLKKLMGPILAGLAIKGGFVAIAFQAIALIAGKALLIGKIALLLSAIIGLKKLVGGADTHEKTTYEIVKHPQVSQSHTYSSSHYGGDFDSTGPGGHYRRSVEDEAAAQDRAYRAYAKNQQE